MTSCSVHPTRRSKADETCAQRTSQRTRPLGSGAPPCSVCRNVHAHTRSGRGFLLSPGVRPGHNLMPTTACRSFALCGCIAPLSVTAPPRPARLPRCSYDIPSPPPPIGGSTQSSHHPIRTSPSFQAPFLQPCGQTSPLSHASRRDLTTFSRPHLHTHSPPPPAVSRSLSRVPRLCAVCCTEFSLSLIPPAPQRAWLQKGRFVPGSFTAESPAWPGGRHVGAAPQGPATLRLSE